MCVLLLRDGNRLCTNHCEYLFHLIRRTDSRSAHGPRVSDTFPLDENERRVRLVTNTGSAPRARTC